MALFIDWMIFRDVAALIHLINERADFFTPQDYNNVFDGELGKLLTRIPDSEARQLAAEMRGYDWAGYVERSLRKSGIRDDDALQDAFHEIAIKLLVEPGKLFRGWEPHRHGPLQRRFRRSVWNAIRNIAEKSQNRRKWMVSADPSVLAGKYAGRETYASVIDEFRNFVAQRLGTMALAILDQRLAGEDVKNLVGKAEYGTKSAFYIKREVRAIKELAQQFAARLGNPAFANMVSRAMAEKTATLARRKQSIAARQV